MVKKSSRKLVKVISVPVLVLAGFIILVIGVGAYYVNKNEKALSNPFAVPTNTPTPTETPTPTFTLTPTPTKIPLPTKPKPTATPAVSPTPGELGFEVPDAAEATFVKGSCAKAITIKSKTSTSFRLEITRDSSQPRSLYNSVHWQNPDNVTMEKGSSLDMNICADSNIVACGHTGCTSGKFYDNTTGYVKGIKICLTIKCSP